MNNSEEKITKKIKIFKIIIKILKIITIINIILIAIDFKIYNYIYDYYPSGFYDNRVMTVRRLIVLTIIQIINIVLLIILSKKLNQENSNWKSMMKIIISVILIVITFSIPVGMTELTLGEKGETDHTYYDEKGRIIHSPAYYSNGNGYELQYKNIYYITLWKRYTSIGINDIDS